MWRTKDKDVCEPEMKISLQILLVTLNAERIQILSLFV